MSGKPVVPLHRKTGADSVPENWGCLISGYIMQPIPANANARDDGASPNNAEFSIMIYTHPGMCTGRPAPYRISTRRRDKKNKTLGHLVVVDGLLRAPLPHLPVDALLRALLSCAGLAIVVAFVWLDYMAFPLSLGRRVFVVFLCKKK